MKKVLMSLAFVASAALPVQAQSREAVAADFFARQFCRSYAVTGSSSQARADAAVVTIARFGSNLDTNKLAYYAALLQAEYCPHAL